MTTPHEPTDACTRTHCYGCHLDHEGKAWLWCFECGHAYRRPRDLRKAYRRKAWEALRNDYTWPAVRVPLLVSDQWHSSIVWQVWTILTIRAKKIAFCQFCIHDF